MSLFERYPSWTQLRQPELNLTNHVTSPIPAATFPNAGAFGIISSTVGGSARRGWRRFAFSEAALRAAPRWLTPLARKPPSIDR